MAQKENIPVLWKEEFSNVWMVEVENEAFLSDALDTYQVVRNIVDSMVDTVDAHNVVRNIVDSMMDTVDAYNVVRNILFDIINTITTLTQL